MNLKEILTGSSGILLVIFTLVQISPIKINPWSWIAKSIGNALNGDVIKKVDKLSDDVQTLRNECEEREAMNSRTRILHFGDEIRHKGRHSKEHFDQIMVDVKTYETYCDTHPQFENNVAVETIRILKEVYHDCMKNNSFLE